MRMTGLAVAAGIWLLVGSGAVAHRAPADRVLHSQTPALRHQVDRLSVSANRRFLQHADGSPFFWLGDTAWLLFTRLDRAQTARYLDDRRAKDFNVIQVMVLREADDRAANGATALVDGDPGRARLRVHLHLHRSPVRRSPGNTVRKPAQRVVVQPA